MTGTLAIAILSLALYAAGLSLRLARNQDARRVGAGLMAAGAVGGAYAAILAGAWLYVAMDAGAGLVAVSWIRSDRRPHDPAP